MTVRPREGLPSDALPFAALLAIGFLQAAAANALGVGVPMQIVRLGGTPFVLGLAFTAWAAGRSLMGFCAGQRFDSAGGRWTLVAGFSITAIVALLYALARNPDLFVLMRLGQGMGAGLYWTAILSLVGESAQGPERLRRLATFNNLVAVGGIAGSLLGGWAIGGLGRSAPMWGGMVLAVILAALTLISVPARPAHAACAPRAAGRMRRAAISASLLAAASQLPSLLTNAGLPLLLTHRGLGGAALGIENALMVGGALIGQTLYTRYSAWGSTRRGTLLLYMVGAMALLAIGVGTGTWLLLAIAVLGSAVRLLGVVWMYTVQSVAGGEGVGRATGLTRSSGDVLSALAYPMVGVAEQSLGITVALLAAVFAASAAFVSGRGGQRWFPPHLRPDAKMAGD